MFKKKKLSVSLESLGYNFKQYEIIRKIALENKDYKDSSKPVSGSTMSLSLKDLVENAESKTTKTI